MSGMSWVLIYTVFFFKSPATGHVYFQEGAACTQALKNLEDGYSKAAMPNSYAGMNFTGFCVRTSLSDGP